MTSKVLEIYDIIEPDRLATRITEFFIEWDMLRIQKKNDWEEIRRYVYQTDTTQTTNSKLPWKNKTTVPKLCQIRDNLYSNYTATLFPQRKWLVWEANEQDSNSRKKRDAITNYMSWVIEQPTFKTEIDKIILDYIDFGNCFATVEWADERVEHPGSVQAGYIGPKLRRISPLDIVCNPTVEDFESSPKIVRTITNMGEVKKMLMRLSNDENRQTYEALYKYLKDIRSRAHAYEGDWIQRDNLYSMDGFSSFRQYLQSDVVEVLTFYGDIYDRDSDTFLENYVITVVDRHKIIASKPNPSFFSHAPIYHSPWRRKQDNLWGMGPLDNLIGMQYRIDHIENMKADIFDLVTFPVQKIKGFVEDYNWEPGAKIFVGDEGDVQLVTPEVNVLQAPNMEIMQLANSMEEYAGAPKEAMGFRTPGEKTKYEVQRLENAAARVFQNKINQFEEQIVEKILNAMLELARRNLVGAVTIKVLDDNSIASFQELTADDITGIGRIKPIAARHFAEQADLIQNLTSLTSSGLWPTVQPHFSAVIMAKMISNIFNLDDYGVFLPYIALAEQADGQKFAQSLQEQVVMEAGTASGMNGDYDISAAVPQQQQQPQGTPVPQAQPQQSHFPLGLSRQPPANAEPIGTLGTQ